MHVAINAHLLNSDAGYRQSGVSRYIANLLPALIRVGTDVDRWTIFAPAGIDVENISPNSSSVTVVNSILPTRRPIARILWEQMFAPVAIARNAPDVMLCPLNVVPLLAPCPTVVTVHDLAFLRLKTHTSSRRSYLSIMTRRSVQRSSHAMAVSEFTRREVIDLLGTSPNRVTTVPNACDPSFFPIPAAQVAVWKEKNKVPDRYLLSVGTLEPRKNLVGLIKAFADLIKTHNVMLIIVGAPGWHFTPIFDTVRALGLEAHVRFEGFVSDQDLAFYYAGSIGFVYPSFYEGFGLPPLEAMTIGTPVITSNVSSLPEVVGSAALLVSPDSHEELVDAMKRIVSDAGLRTELIAAGLERSKLFNWDLAAESAMNILRTAAGVAKSPQPSVQFSTL